ncbi:WXG100 family type VII secretion target [Streptomyces sp. 147326]|uniref:WXG100 family type VII secretion target n=1 Tax=Streptomyces sp. 147326 TaxID=3074379 RepID=UPI003857D630
MFLPGDDVTMTRRADRTEQLTDSPLTRSRRPYRDHGLPIGAPYSNQIRSNAFVEVKHVDHLSTRSSGEGGTVGYADLSVEAERLKSLARDLDAMQEVLTKQLLRMDEIVDAIEARWRGPAAEAYRARHRAAAEDAVTIRGTMKLLAKTVSYVVRRTSRL